MKKILLFGLFLFGFSYSYAQEYCENFKIVSVIDFPPSPQTPGGNYFLLLLTVFEDNPSNSTIYTNLFFLDELGDTISIPTGPSSHLPVYTTDTIPYILELNTTTNNQDFPLDFNGQLIIIHPIHPKCEVDFSNVATNIDDISDGHKINIFPNPFTDEIKIESVKQIEKILIVNSVGRIIDNYYPKIISPEMNLSNMESGWYFVVLQFEDGESLVKKLFKM